MRTLRDIGSRLPPFYVFLMMLVIGIIVHRDYGVSADEPAMRKFGNDAFAYLFQGGPIPTEQDWAFFNPIVQIVMRGFELAFGLTDGADIWFMRHLVTFLLFFATIAAFYGIAWQRYRDWKLPLLGSVMFFVSPRLFAHGFYNPKDIPALLFFTLSAWTLLLFLERRRGWQEHSAMKLRIRMTVLYVVCLAVALFLVWPMLWSNPIGGLIGAFMNNTSRMGGGFYFGEQISAAGVPWHYLPTWIAITTPVVYSALFLTGFVTLWVRCTRNPFCLVREKPASGLALLWFSLPVIALLIFPIGIFDEWRHVLFLYPAFLIIALEGLAWATMVLKGIWRKIVYGILLIQLITTGFWMLKNHPFEYMYFSLPAGWVDGQFELDYWSLSYRAGLEWIVKNDARERINVHVVARTGKAAADTLPLEEWNRLYFVEQNEADYILDNFRGNAYQRVLPEEKKVHAITVDGMEILAIYSR
jgi:hypothetical protein